MLHRPIDRISQCILIAAFIVFILPAFAQDSSVRVWEETVTIPTYLVGDPEPNPIFYTHESYQGAQKRIYPYAMIDRLTPEREPRDYTALFLENEYIKISVLPEIGGRLFSATDKTDNYDFFYHQHVIKPALIGMLGAWISGGIEWCVFHHHRNTTFMPVDYHLVNNVDGSKSIWFGETERRHRMKWIIGLTLYPGKSYLEANVKMFNRTAEPHSILYWANVAVHVNDDYQVFFPPSVQVATYHSKIDFTHWPISQERYRGRDYNGLDISWWKNSESSNSFFAWHLKENFMGGYDHGKEAGMVHVGNHNIVTGAKLWEWGTGTYGRRWDDILTDEDGPYAELMVGAYSDNQPDYSWIKPHEVKDFKQYWYPIKEIGGIKNANLNGAVNLDKTDEGNLLVGFHVTSERKNAKVMVTSKGKTIHEATVDLSPATPYRVEIPFPGNASETDIRAALLSSDGAELVSYQPKELKPVESLPEPVQPPPPPDKIKTIEELYYTGKRVQQIHNPSVDPAIYYEDALKRDPNDERTNIIVGTNLIKRGMYEKAEEHLRRAVARITKDYTRPANTEAFYQLGLALRAQNRLDEAYDAFYRATWDTAFHSAAYYQLAELSSLKGDYQSALDQIERSLSTNTKDTKARNLKAMMLRKLGRYDPAYETASDTLKIDSLDFIAINEMKLSMRSLSDATESEEIKQYLTKLMRGNVQSYLECACDYRNAGLWYEAVELLEEAKQSDEPLTKQSPLVYYYLGELYKKLGNERQSKEHFAAAAEMPSDYCFPFRLETADVLGAALAANPNDKRAHYYLGDLYYEIQPDRAIVEWEQARETDPTFALTYRNLGWAYYRHKKDIPLAIASYEKAIAADASDPLYYLELDRLYELDNAKPERRLALFDGHHDVVKQRKESFVREIRVQVFNGHYQQAIDYLTNNHFPAQEGGENLHDIYADAHLLQGLQELNSGQPAKALEHFQLAAEYPENLPEGRQGFDRRTTEYNYHIGLAYQALGKNEEAKAAFKQAAGNERGGSGRGGFGRRSRASDSTYYRGMSLKALGQNEESEEIFQQLAEQSRNRLTEDEGVDFFAKFGEQNTRQLQAASAHYTLGLGLLAQNKTDEGLQELKKAIELNQSHIWARYYLQANTK